jgi:predicted lipoprotein
MKIAPKKIIKMLITVTLIFCLLMAGTACGIATVVRISDNKIISGNSETEYYMGDEEFDADKFVSGIWESEALPFLKENAQDYQTLMQGLEADFKATGEKFGYTRSSNAENFNFIIKTKGKVLNVNEESRVGYCSIDAEPYDGKEDFKLLIGPVYKGDSLRNSLPFIKFDAFKSQNDYAKVSKALHEVIQNTVISGMDKGSIAGREIELTGTFTAEKIGEELLVTPAIIEMVEE